MIRNSQSGLRRWREVKRRPVQGNSPNDRILRGPDCYRHKRVYADSFPATPLPQVPGIQESSRNAFGEACGIYRSDGDQTNSQKGPPYRLPLVGPEVAVAARRIHYEVLSPTPFLCRAVQKCEGPRNAFVQAWRNLSVRCVITAGKPGPRRRLPVGLGPGYRTRREEHALPIVRDEFRPVIPRSGCSPALPVSASPASSE